MMTNTKDTLIQELKTQFQALKQLQTKSPDVFLYLPGDLKLVIKESTDLLKGNYNTTEDNKNIKPQKSKDKCADMEANWQKHIIEPFTKEAYAILKSSESTKEDLFKLAEEYYKKYRKKKWFDPNIQKQGDDAQHYIEVAPIYRKITLHRDMITGSAPPEEMKSNYSGAIKNTKDVQVGMSDIIEIEVPSNNPKKLILGGQLIYTLDNLQIPDTFVLLDNGKAFYNKNITKKVEDVVVPFSNLSGNLFIDVQESTNFSIWAAEINLTFLQVTFKEPKCLDNDIPCPDNSIPSPKKKPGKTPCPKF